MTQPLHTQPSHLHNLRRALERASRQSTGLKLNPTLDHLGELELSLTEANGIVARMRRGHHTRIGRDQARTFQGRQPHDPDTPTPPAAA